MSEGRQALVRDARARLSAAIEPVFGAAEAALPFGLSKRRMEVNAAIAAWRHGEAEAHLRRVIEEIAAAGLGEESPYGRTT